jgi:ubiquitin
MAFFIAIVSISVTPLQCSEHPDDKWTVRAYPTVVCWTTGEHHEMAAAGACFTLAPIAFLAIVGRATKLFPARMQQMDTGFLRCYRFLFFRFKTETHWYVLVFLSRNMFIALTPVLPNVVAQILFLNIVILAAHSLACHTMPWRVHVANYIDIVSTAGIVLIMTLACIYVQGNTDSVSLILCILLSAAVLLMGCGALYGICKAFVPRRKQFQLFICHHKAGAGAFARLLKMMFGEERSRMNVFIDSDNLSNLDTLFDIVANDVEKLLVVCSAEILRRPWCLGEITTAHRKQLKTLLLYCPDFTQPSDDFIRDFVTHVPNAQCLTENNLSVENVQAALTWLVEELSAEHMDVPNKLFMPDIKGFVKNILTGASNVTEKEKSTKADAPSEIYIATDEDNSEAVSSGRILCMLLGQHASSIVLREPSKAPRLMMDIQEGGKLSDSARLVAVLLTGDCIKTHRILDKLYQALKTGCKLIPVQCDESFRFPQDSFYIDLHPIAFALLQKPDYATKGSRQVNREAAFEEAGWLVDGIENMFKNIAVLFQPLGSASTLETQSRAIYTRIYVDSGSQPSGFTKKASDKSQRTKDLEQGTHPVKDWEAVIKYKIATV